MKTLLQNLLFVFISALFISPLGLAPAAHAGGFQGSFQTSSDEQAMHLATLPKLMQTASECLTTYLSNHKSFYQKYGVSPYFGDQSSFSKLSHADRKEVLMTQMREHGVSESSISRALRSTTWEATSCIGLTLKCLGSGFNATGQAEVWKRLLAYTKLNGADGSSLQNGLQELGWRVLYWNPNTSKAAAWDEAEQSRWPGDPKHIWGHHADNWSSVRNRGRYLYNDVDDISSLVNFGIRVPAKFKSVPFFVGIAHMGYHVFPGAYGQVIEGHSTRSIDDPQTLEGSEFNPLANGGGPRGNYMSGLIAVPPGFGL
jgi:hypothetical protein